MIESQLLNTLFSSCIMQSTIVGKKTFYILQLPSWPRLVGLLQYWNFSRFSPLLLKRLLFRLLDVSGQLSHSKLPSSS